VQLPVAVEKLHFRQNIENLGDTKCPEKPRTSFVGLPIEEFFQPVFGERVFQQPRLVTTTIIYRDTANGQFPTSFVKLSSRPNPNEYPI
jgi:hypothetical protein